MTGAFRIVAWDRDFIDGLTTLLLDETGGDFSNVTLVFPHRRPKRYLLHSLTESNRLKRPCILPHIVSVDDWFAELGQTLAAGQLSPVESLDRIALLHRCVLDLVDAGRIGEYPREFHTFYPWGRHLDTLFEELFRQCITPSNIDHVRDLVVEEAAVLLENLKAIHDAYVQTLRDNHLSTPGFLQAQTALSAETIVSLHTRSRIHLCGFYALSTAEETVFSALWKNGIANMICHADPNIVLAPKNVHYACTDIVDLCHRFKAKPLLHKDFSGYGGLAFHPHAKTDQASLFDAASSNTDDQSPRSDEERLVIYEGFDLHSQLKALRADMEHHPITGTTAIVLPDTGMLMPVLHHLPRTDVNISMGFPLARSTLYQLLDAIIRLQLSKERVKGSRSRYYWRDVVRLLRHPYFKHAVQQTDPEVAQLLHAIEDGIRHGEPYVDIDSAVVQPLSEQEELALDQERIILSWSRLTDLFLHQFDTLTHLAGLAESIYALAGMFLDTSSSDEISPDKVALAIWERFPLDAECLFRLLDVMLPQLTYCKAAHEPFPQHALFAIFRHMVESERVAFEGDPLTGMQILGVLETRLLCFDTVYVLGAVEDVLPQSAKPDPLLPDPLREMLGLSANRHRDHIAAYNFHRLINGARRVVLLYQDGVTGGLFEDKAIRSRFVEQLIWENERKLKRLLQPGEAPLVSISLPVPAISRQLGIIESTPQTVAALQHHLGKYPLSATFFDTYLRCPFLFFHNYISKISPLEEINEDGDPAQFGSLVHTILHEYFAPYLKKYISGQELDPAPLIHTFHTALEKEPFFARVPADIRLCLRRTGTFRLRQFLENTPTTMPIGLESTLNGSIHHNRNLIRLLGRVDRIDLRGEERIVLDYKTGKAATIREDFWDQDALKLRMEEWEPDDTELLPEVAASVRSVQLPLYCLLYEQTTGILPDNAAFVLLGENGTETSLFSEKIESHDRQRHILSDLPRLLRFLVDHMQRSPTFPATPSKGCAWCAYKPLCAVKKPDYAW
ncbi:PD-(D/E)XK nuclease family protein [Desulfovibrio inopinatus]|uniref:PD-(D/E)XK nuclease family protein n=1 Tax=Desulfovibrio inopinatus TaxID=102109 RepID=UPI00041A75CD|nr:PD-(D/E)XK nuclease family protein [Desulfovibrio inopinatus]